MQSRPDLLDIPSSGYAVDQVAHLHQGALANHLGLVALAGEVGLIVGLGFLFFRCF